MSAIEFSIQSVNEIWMMSVRKYSIGVIRWCFFFLPRSFIFPGRRRLSFFFYQYRWIICFCQVGLMFSWQNKWEHASFGRNKTSVELAQKNLADLLCKFLMQHQNMKTSSAVKKHYLPVSVFKKKLGNVGWKISVGPISRPLSAIEFSIQSLNEIFGRCLLGNVRSASYGDSYF